MTNRDIKIPYYSGNIKLTKCIGHVTLSKFIESHRYPIIDTCVTIEAIQKAAAQEVKRELKQKLFSFTPAVKIEVGCVRKYENVVEWTGLAQLDFDNIETIEKAHELKEYLFLTYQCVICSYISPSGKGVKALISITKPTSKEHYRAIYKTIQKEFGQISYFDVATKNGILPLFLSIDTQIYYRDYSETIPWSKEDWTEERLVTSEFKQVATPTSNFSAESKQDKYYLRITEEIFERNIANINDNGHPQLRKACLILGSRSAAGYIDLQYALAFAENQVRTNEYFYKGMKGYLDTMKWAINEGYKKPLYYS